MKNPLPDDICLKRNKYDIGDIYLIKEKNRAKLFTDPLEMKYEGISPGKKVVHHKFRSTRGGFLLSLTNRQIVDYKISKKQGPGR